MALRATRMMRLPGGMEQRSHSSIEHEYDNTPHRLSRSLSLSTMAAPKRSARPEELRSGDKSSGRAFSCSDACAPNGEVRKRRRTGR